MFRLSKITDYGIVLLARLARDTAGTTHNARELAAEVDLPAPVVSKILKLLARAGVLESHRGAKGGYTLLRQPHDLTVAEMIRVLEGPVALTQCSAASSSCEHETNCAVRDPWRVISGVVEEALSTITLEDLNDRSFREVLLPLQIEGSRVEPGDKIAGGL
jgi:FeS assembly SUF system regulator